MAFEPLNTDERLEKPVKPERDMDGQMLFGCSGFLVASLGGYALAVWPFFAFTETQQLRILAQSCALGLIPAALLAAWVSRKFALAGACGAVGGAIATAMFLFLRIQQIFTAAALKRIPPPEYPESMQAVLPVAWILAAILIGLAVMPKEPE